MPRENSDSAKLRTINDLKKSIDIQMEIEFTLGKHRYLLEPDYGENDIDAVAWNLSWDNGTKEKEIDATTPDEVLNVKVDGVPLKKQWRKMNMISY